MFPKAFRDLRCLPACFAKVQNIRVILKHTQTNQNTRIALLILNNTHEIEGRLNIKTRSTSTRMHVVMDELLNSPQLKPLSTPADKLGPAPSPRYEIITYNYLPLGHVKEMLKTASWGKPLCRVTRWHLRTTNDLVLASNRYCSASRFSFASERKTSSACATRPAGNGCRILHKKRTAATTGVAGVQFQPCIRL